DGTPGDENMPVLKAFLSDDKQSVFIAVPNMEKVMQMSLNYSLRTADGKDFQNDFYFTVNELTEPNLSLLGFGSLGMDDITFEFDPSQLASQDITPTVELGADMFVKMGCIACHAVDDDDQAKIGPPMIGLYGSLRKFNDGTSATADEAYLMESIISPGAKVVEGREGEMPSFLGILSEAEIESVILYIKSLAK